MIYIILAIALLVWLAFSVFILTMLWKMGKARKEYEKLSKELMDEGYFVPPFPAAR